MIYLLNDFFPPKNPHLFLPNLIFLLEGSPSTIKKVYIKDSYESTDEQTLSEMVYESVNF